MVLSEVQAQYLLLILRDSLLMNLRGIFSIDFEQRTKLLNEILNQQNKTPVEMDKDV